MSHPRRHLVVGFTALALGAAALSGGAAQADTSPYTTVITGLNNPRDVAFDTAGNLYVSQAGTYQGDAGYSPTGGSVTKYAPDGTLIWSTWFTSLWDSENGPEVLGPGGLGVIGSKCVSPATGARHYGQTPSDGCDVLVIENESPGSATNPAWDGATGLGNLSRLDGSTGALSVVSDVGAQMFQWTTEHADQPWAPHYPNVPPFNGAPQFPDSNPYAVLVTRVPRRGGAQGGLIPNADTIRTFVADAGANTISEIMPGGTARVLAYLPSTSLSDAIPTCIAQGPDGYLYVGTLHLFDFFLGGPGTAQVYKVNPNYTGSDPTKNATLWAGGMTTITGCTFDKQGNFWASEMFTNTVAEIKAGHHNQTLADTPGGITHYAGFPTPGGMTLGPDGGIYLTIGANDPFPGSGQVVKINQ